MKKPHELLERAIELTRTHLLLPNEPAAVDEKRKGDIAAFGTALMQSGLLPAVALFSDTSTDSGKRRNAMLNTLFVLCGYGTEFKKNDKALLTYILEKKDPNERAKIRRTLMAASIALKLAIRTFHLKKEKEL